MNTIKAYPCGVYKRFSCELKRKYIEDRVPVALPDEFTVLIVPSEMIGELQESLSIAGYQVSCEDNR